MCADDENWVQMSANDFFLIYFFLSPFSGVLPSLEEVGGGGGGGQGECESWKLAWRFDLKKKQKKTRNPDNGRQWRRRRREETEAKSQTQEEEVPVVKKKEEEEGRKRKKNTLIADDDFPHKKERKKNWEKKCNRYSGETVFGSWSSLLWYPQVRFHILLLVQYNSTKCAT